MNATAARPKPAAASLKVLKLVVRALDDKKAGDLRVLDVRAKSSITDYLVVATGTSEPHLRALCLELERVLDAARVPIVGVENEHGSGWTVFDAFDVMIHLLTEENRARYRLEFLWKDAAEVAVPALLAVRRRAVAGPTGGSRRRSARDAGSGGRES
jgi:ribosome-associated protein